MWILAVGTRPIFFSLAPGDFAGNARRDNSALANKGELFSRGSWPILSWPPRQRMARILIFYLERS